MPKDVSRWLAALAFVWLLPLITGRCEPPEFELGAFSVENNLLNGAVSEVKFVTYLGGVNGTNPQICKIKCVGEQWVGPFCSVQSGSNASFQALLRGCHFPGVPESDLRIAYNGKYIKSDQPLDVDTGETLYATCPPLGKKKLLGHSEIQCFDGRWSHMLPECLSTAPVDSNSDESSPSILFSDASGNVYQTPEGSILVRPGAVIHFDCIFPRITGNPIWSYTQTERQYPKGWSMARNERDRNYRISVIYAKYEDTGVFTCATPHGHANSISLLVKDVSCAPQEDIFPPLFANFTGRYAGQHVFYTCAEGYRLVGDRNATCLQSGSWSSSPPNCEVIICDIPESRDPRVDVLVTGLTLHSEAKFTCPKGYALSPNKPIVTCTEFGNWTAVPPACKEVICPPPLPPLNGYVEEGMTHRVGERIRYRCNREYFMHGRSVAVCSQSGQWSTELPICIATCRKPYHLPSSITLEPSKHRYLAGEKATISCRKARLTITCQGNNEWLGNFGACIVTS